MSNPPTIEQIQDDPDDNIILACAVAGNADYIVSGDPHLKELGEYEEIQIIAPSDFLKLL